MLPFDLTKALQGHKLITRDGSHKNITIFLPDDRDLTRDFPLIGTNNGEYRASYALSGSYLIYTKDDLDLFLQEDSDLIEESSSINHNHIKRELIKARDKIQDLIDTLGD